MKHTPGPWRIQKECWEPEKHAYGLRIESTSDIETLGVHSGRKIAEIPRSLGIDVSAANARLIIAAPEMLDALKRARQEIYGNYLAAGGDDEALTNPSMIKTSQLINKLDDLIARAEGRVRQ